MNKVPSAAFLRNTGRFLIGSIMDFQFRSGNTDRVIDSLKTGFSKHLVRNKNFPYNRIQNKSENSASEE